MSKTESSIISDNELYSFNKGGSGSCHILYDLANWKNGLAFKNIDFSPTGKPVIKIAELNDGIGPTTAYTEKEYPKEVYLQKGDFLFSWSGNPQTSIDIYKFQMQEGWLNQHIFKVIPNEKLVHRDFFFYLMKALKPNFTKIATNKQTTGLGHVTIADLKRLEVTIPDYNKQKKIAQILLSLDEKIELNNAINRNLEEQAQAIFKSWFVDFEPFGGTMPEDWKLGTVADITVSHDSKRIPLSGMQRDFMKKIYPYYGATSCMDYVEDYIFDGIYLLLGEDGTVVDKDGFPILQYVEGKFWVNNHAHILTGKSGYSVEMLYLFFSLTKVQEIVTGAVQPKISQGRLNGLTAIIPDEKTSKAFDEIIQPMFRQIRLIRQETQRLTSLRDVLLPKLISREC